MCCTHSLDPQFYVCWLMVALFIGEVGRWISVGLFMQALGKDTKFLNVQLTLSINTILLVFLVSVFLLVPVALTHGWLREGSAERVGPAAMSFKDNVTILAAYYWRVIKSKISRLRARR